MWNFQTFDNDFFSTKYNSYCKIEHWISIKTFYDKKEMKEKKEIKEMEFTFFSKKKSFKTIKVYIDYFMASTHALNSIFYYFKRHIELNPNYIIIPNSIHLSYNEKVGTIVKVEDLNCYWIKWDLISSLICSLKGTYYTFVDNSDMKTFLYTKQNKEETELKDGFIFDFKKKDFSSFFFLSDDDKYWSSYLSNKNINKFKYEKFISENHDVNPILVNGIDYSSKWKFVWNINYFNKIFEDIEREIKKIKPTINNFEIQIKNFSYDETFKQMDSNSNDEIYSHKVKFYVDIILDKEDAFNNKNKEFVRMLMNLMKTSMGYVDFITQETEWEKLKDKLIYKVVIRSYYLHNWGVPLSSFISLVDKVNYGFKIKDFLNDYYIFEEKSQWVGGDIIYNQKIYRYDEETNNFVYIDDIKPKYDINEYDNYEIRSNFLSFVNTKNQLRICLNKENVYIFDVPKELLSPWNFVQNYIQQRDNLIYFNYEDGNKFICYNIYDVNGHLDIQKIILKQNEKNSSLDCDNLCDYNEFCVTEELIWLKKENICFRTATIKLNFPLSRISRCYKEGLNISTLTFRDILSLSYFIELINRKHKESENNLHYRLKLNIKWINLIDYPKWNNAEELYSIWNENLYQVNVDKEGNHRLLGMLIPNEVVLLKQKRIRNFVWCSLDNLKLSIYVPELEKNYRFDI